MKQLQAFVKQERASKEVYPAREDVFKALHLTPYKNVTTVILGQDPYHTPGVADGLAFSSGKAGVCPPSLEVVIQALVNDLKEFGTKLPYNPIKEFKSFSLQRWAEEEGVLLLNPVLTVEKGKAGSHKDKGWEIFTGAIMDALKNHPKRLVVMLWGKEAQKYFNRFEGSQHLILTAPHPAAELYNPKAGFTTAKQFYQERIFRLEQQMKFKSKQWPVTWLNLPKRSL